MGVFFRERKRSYGGVTRKNYGQVICNLSGSVDCINANGAEISAMLMGCRELRKIKAIDAMVKGHSFSAI